MYEDIILEIIQHVKDDIEVDKLEINKIRKERNKLKKYIKAGEDLQLYNDTLGLEIFRKEECINDIKENNNGFEPLKEHLDSWINDKIREIMNKM